MDSPLALLLNLLKIMDLARTEESALTFASIENIIASVLSDVLSNQELQRIATTLDETSSQDTGFASVIERIDDAASVLRNKAAHSAHFSAKSIAINKSLDDLFALWSMIHARAVGHADITMSPVDVFNYIETIRIEPELDQPYTVLVGQHDTSVYLSNNSYIARKTEILYGSTSPYPKLNLKTPSKRPRSILKHGRSEWLQRGLPEYDLDVYTYQQRLAGHICTREEPLPYVIPGKNHRLTIPAQTGMVLLATSICNEKGAPLMRCLRVVHV